MISATFLLTLQANVPVQIADSYQSFDEYKGIRKDMRFEEVIGQQAVKERLARMASEERLPHAIMLCGPNGVGKMALALAFASRLLGDSTMLDRWEHPDLLFSFPVIRPTGTSSDHKMNSDDFAREWHEMICEGPYFTLNEWLLRMNAENQQAIIGAGESDRLIHKLSLKSSQGGYKICIIWLAERMNQECANKLLKLLEEPPAQTVFIMTVEKPEQLLDTIKSRVQRVDVKGIAEADMAQALVEERGVESDVARRVARSAGGSWAKAVEELRADNEGVQFLEMFKALMRQAYARDIRGLKKWSEAVASYGRERQKRLLQYFGKMVRENFMYNFGLPELNYLTQEEEAFSRNFARFINESNVADMAEELQKAEREITQNANPKIVFFDLTLNIIQYLIRK